MKTEPQKEHRWLETLLGEWTFEAPGPPAADGTPTKQTGTASVRSFGGIWILCEGRAEVPGAGEMKSIITLGYDPAKKRFVGTFIATMMASLWIYEGELDAAGKVLTLDTEGPSFTTEGQISKYKDSIEIVSPDHWVLSSRHQDDAGKWHDFMRSDYHRTK